MKLFETENIEDILRKINKFAFHEMSTSDINSGDCYNWAALVKHFFPTADLLKFEGHAFVKIGQKFYDAERLKGVLDWKKLPANKSGNLFRDCDTFTEEEFYKRWKINKSHINKLIRRIQGGVCKRGFVMGLALML